MNQSKQRQQDKYFKRDVTSAAHQNTSSVILVGCRLQLKVMMALSKSSLHQLSLTSHKCLFLCYFSLDFLTYYIPWRWISVKSSLGSSSGWFSVLCAAVWEAIVWHCTVSWLWRLSQWNCQVMKKFHTDCFPPWGHLFCSYLSQNIPLILGPVLTFCRPPVHACV